MRKKQSKIQTNYFVDRNSLMVHGAVLLMALSALFRVIGCFGLRKEAASVPTLIVLPLACNLLYIAFLLLFGKRALWMTSFPFTMGSVFFIVKSFRAVGVFGEIVCILLFVSAAVIYISTTSGWLKSKWLLLLLLISAFIYYVAVEDLRVFTNPLETVTFSTVMQEISSVFILLSFLFAVLAMKNRKPLEECDLPKMKAPRISVRNAKNRTPLSDETGKQSETVINGQNTDKAELATAKNAPEEPANEKPVPAEASEKNIK